jgi:hypothetical protein
VNTNDLPLPSAASRDQAHSPARLIAEAARNAAAAWEQARSPAAITVAASLLAPAVQNLSAAVRNLAGYTVSGHSGSQPGLTADTVNQHLIESAESIRGAWGQLQGIPPAAAASRPADAAHALQDATAAAVTAWREPAGTAAARNRTVVELMAAVDAMAIAAGNLGKHAAGPLATQLKTTRFALDLAYGFLDDALECAAGNHSPGTCVNVFSLLSGPATAPLQATTPPLASSTGAASLAGTSFPQPVADTIATPEAPGDDTPRASQPLARQSRPQGPAR